jgi:hypothetical protein
MATSRAADRNRRAENIVDRAGHDPVIEPRTAFSGGRTPYGSNEDRADLVAPAAPQTKHPAFDRVPIEKPKTHRARRDRAGLSSQSVSISS